MKTDMKNYTIMNVQNSIKECYMLEVNLKMSKFTNNLRKKITKESINVSQLTITQFECSPVNHRPVERHPVDYCPVVQLSITENIVLILMSTNTLHQFNIYSGISHIEHNVNNSNTR